MPELRLNLVTREWVVISTERAKRPEEFVEKKDKKHLPPYLDSCPFCIGNEARTPDEIMRIPNDHVWKVRVTPNKFPCFSSTGKRERKNEGMRHLVTGVGRHEVIVESPLHNEHMATLPLDDVAHIIRTYRMRFDAIYEDERVEHVIIFKNHGEHSGTSLDHPHTQIIGTPIIPLKVRMRVEEGTRYFDNTGECLICASLHDELTDGRRILLDSTHFVSFIPYAALAPFHTWTFPKRHCATFSTITEEEIQDLAFHLRTLLAKFYFGLQDPDFNFILRSQGPTECKSEYFHWYVSIVPRVMQAAGFELGSGIYINTTIPEETAGFLRKITV